MITFNLRSPENLTPKYTSIGVTGDNLTNELDFLIKNLSDSEMNFFIHLRFKDGSVNSVIPDSTELTAEGTLIHWKIKKSDIFCHGFFELQIECKKDERIMQTEIIRLFADESICVEDKTYTNPNSENLAIREEIYALILRLEEQNKLIEQNKSDIASYNLAAKENISDKVNDKRNVIDENIQYPSIAYLRGYYYDIDEIDTMLAEKANTSAVYTKKEIDTMLAGISFTGYTMVATRTIEQNTNKPEIFTKEEVIISE